MMLGSSQMISYHHDAPLQRHQPSPARKTGSSWLELAPAPSSTTLTLSDSMPSKVESAASRTTVSLASTTQINVRSISRPSCMYILMRVDAPIPRVSRRGFVELPAAEIRSLACCAMHGNFPLTGWLRKLLRSQLVVRARRHHGAGAAVKWSDAMHCPHYGPCPSPSLRVLTSIRGGLLGS